MRGKYRNAGYALEAITMTCCLFRHKDAGPEITEPLCASIIESIKGGSLFLSGWE